MLGAKEDGQEATTELTLQLPIAPLQGRHQERATRNSDIPDFAESMQDVELGAEGCGNAPPSRHREASPKPVFTPCSMIFQERACSREGSREQRIRGNAPGARGVS